MEPEFKPGDRVRMTKALRKLLNWSSREHVREFGLCIGIVQGPTDFNNCKPGEPGYDPSKVGPEIDVRWQPSNLRYAYHPKSLEKV